MNGRKICGQSIAGAVKLAIGRLLGEVGQGLKQHGDEHHRDHFRKETPVRPVRYIVNKKLEAQRPGDAEYYVQQQQQNHSNRRPAIGGQVARQDAGVLGKRHRAWVNE